MNTSTLIPVLWPEIVLTVAACVLFLLGVSNSPRIRRLAPVLAVAVLVGLFCALLIHVGQVTDADLPHVDTQNTLIVGQFATYIKLITTGMGILFVLMAWPTNREVTGNAALDFGPDGGEFFGLMLLSLTGVFLVAGANDIMLLFLGIELASIPTYIMVSISRPLPVAQEAGVKYFFLGAMAAALLLFGFSYLYGTTGLTKLDEITRAFRDTLAHNRTVPAWQLLAIVMLLMGLAFKIAAVPLHGYAGDVYQGAATPVTAFLSFVPKTSGFVAIIKILSIVTASMTQVPDAIFYLLWIIAVLTMTFGNALAVTSQYNIKRVLAYSSVSHSGYMLVGLTAMLAAKGVGDGRSLEVQQEALMGVLFYLCAYGIMNTGAFGVLMMLPGRVEAYGRHGATGEPLPTAGSAETFDDITGAGRHFPALGLAMMVCCMSLTGIPMTIGFFGKVLLIQPALHATANPHLKVMMVWLVIATMANAAVSAGYYLRIVAYMFVRAEPVEAAGGHRVHETPALFASVPVSLSIALSVAGTLFYGMWLPGTARLTTLADNAARIGAQSSAQTVAEAHIVNRSGR